MRLALETFAPERRALDLWGASCRKTCKTSETRAWRSPSRVGCAGSALLRFAGVSPAPGRADQV
jgi:hypothetical protein